MRVKCNYCGQKIGVHWLFNFIWAVLATLIFIILILYLPYNFTRAIGVVIFFIVIILYSVLMARFSPLEQKQKWWQV